MRGGITPIARGVEDFSTRPKASPGKSNSMVLTDTPEAAKREKRWIVPPVVASNEEREAGGDDGVLEDLTGVGTEGLEGMGREDGVDVGAVDEPEPGEESWEEEFNAKVAGDESEAGDEGENEEGREERATRGKFTSVTGIPHTFTLHFKDMDSPRL